MEPALCANGCGFFGNPETRNLCSKCYKDAVFKQSLEALLSSMKIEEEDVKKKAKEVVAVESKSESESEKKQGPSRCEVCRKRVGLTGFVCRCGGTFCGLHRFWDKHCCSFEFKKMERDAIARANPIIKSDKLDRI